MTAEDWVYNWQAHRWLMKSTLTVINDEDMPEELKPDPNPHKPADHNHATAHSRKEQRK